MLWIRFMCVATVLCSAGAVHAQQDPTAPPGQGSVGSLLGGREQTTAEPEALVSLQARVDELASRPDARAVAQWLDAARAALSRARAQHAAGSVAAAERSQQIAAAALSAASHGLARQQAAHDLAAVRRQRDQARGDAEAAMRALEVARAQRDQPSEDATPGPSAAEVSR